MLNANDVVPRLTKPSNVQQYGGYTSIYCRTNGKQGSKHEKRPSSLKPDKTSTLGKVSTAITVAAKDTWAM